MAAEEFKQRNLVGSRFEEVDLSQSRFHNLALHDVKITGAWIRDLVIEGEVEGSLLVNGVDVMPHVEAELNAMQGWYVALGNSIERSTPPPHAQGRPDGRSRILGWVRDPAARRREGELPPGLALAWAGEHVDALRRLEPPLADAADALSRPPEEEAGD